MMLQVQLKKSISVFCSPHTYCTILSSTVLCVQQKQWRATTVRTHLTALNYSNPTLSAPLRSALLKALHTDMAIKQGKSTEIIIPHLQ